MKVYYFIGRLLRPFGLLGLFTFSILTRTSRVRVVVHNERGDVLLVQSWLSGNSWGIPGGGVGRGEDERVAAARELYEETRISADPSALRSLGVLRSFGHNEVLFTTKVIDSDLPAQHGSMFEIKAVAWFSHDELPKLERLAERVLAKLATKS